MGVSVSQRQHSNPVSSQQVSQISLLLALKDFELIIIVRFLSAKDKLLCMALLNRKFYSLVNQHYSWTRFPVRGPRSLVSDSFDFFRSFHEFTRILVPEYPA